MRNWESILRSKKNNPAASALEITKIKYMRKMSLKSIYIYIVSKIYLYPQLKLILLKKILFHVLSDI